MPVFTLKTNVLKAKVTDAFIQELNQVLAHALNKPPQNIFVTVETDLRQAVGGTFEPSGVAVLKSIGKISQAENNVTSQAVFPVITKHLDIPGNRLLLEFFDLSPTNVAKDGKTVA